MGSKIPEARLASGNKVTALEYEEANTKQKISCCSIGCTARLSFVKRHYRHYANKKPKEIFPCFRLKPGENHEEHCRYNLKGMLKLIAKDSDSEIFSSFQKSNFVFRLHVLIKALREATDEEFFLQGKKWGGESNSNKAYSNRGRLTSYLRTLSQIIELRNYCKNNDQLAKLVKLDYDGELINWYDFYYDSENLTELVTRHGVGRVKIPLAIAGHIFKIDNNVVELDSPYVLPDSNNVLMKPAPKIYLNNPNLLSFIDSGNEYVFFGRWEITIKQKAATVAGKPTKVYQNIKMRITESDHFIEI